ncbi:MAG: hypothetical protein GEU82_15275 [Luteitalea sp.]|nr:hypothetical protein [Luteitalea sp.]
MHSTGLKGLIVVILVGALAPSHAIAQQASAIAGVVRDTSGGVLPGVTVEAASPALIEKARTAVTDGEGRYNIVDLRPGTYTITFTLPGFSVVKRDGIQLASGFTATVSADLQVGSLEETITVTRAAPLVDTQNVRRQNVVSSDVLEALPTSTKHVNNVVTLTAGFTGLADVGGQYTSQVGGTYHGKSGTRVTFDGMGIENTSGNSSYQLNSAVVQEMVLQTSGISAESNADGVTINVVPKEGGNAFRFIGSALFSNDSLESSNLTDELRARGLSASNKTLKIFDESASLGGPIFKDKLWFFAAIRTWGFSRKHAGVFWNKTQNVELTPPGAERVVVLWTPWVDRPDDRASGRWEWYDSQLVRMTWQASQKHKFNVIVDAQEACNCGGTSAANAQETQPGYRFEPNKLYQATWNSPQTSRLLLEAGVSAAVSHWNQFWMPGVRPEHIRVNDVGLGIQYGSSPTYRGHPNETDRYSQRFSVSHVTGAHVFKTGIQVEQYVRNNYYIASGNVNYTFRDGVPISLTQHATPYLFKERINPELGVFAQDQWRIARLTMTLGLRFDYMNGSVPTQPYPGETRKERTVRGVGWDGVPRENPWFPPKTFDPVSNVPSWKDVNPRLGVAYDLFGDGRTALKASLGRYVAKASTNVTAANNPIATSVIAANRAWTDTNRDYVPDCDLGDFTANGECGAIDNQNFGRANPNAIRWADDVLSSWNGRDWNWDFGAELQHQLTTGLSLAAGYYRNTAGYFTAATALSEASKVRVTDNLRVTPADFDQYCITAPVDPRLPSGGGYQICGLADVKPDKFGQSDILVRRQTEFGTWEFRNDFFNVTMDARFGRGGRFSGGLDTGRSVTDRCFVVDSPQELLNCRVVTPFKAQTQIKLNGSYPLPAGFVVSATYQNTSGIPVEANYAASTAEIAPSLGRNLAGGARTATVPLIAPQTVFEDRLSRLDLRLTRTFQIGRARVQANVDFYNALNASSVRVVNTTYGASWRTPAQILDPRIVQFGGTVTF